MQRAHETFLKWREEHTFNSLFEMQYAERFEDVWTPLTFTFNSLFEMQYDFRAMYPSLMANDFQFSI